LEDNCQAFLLKFLTPTYYQFVANEWLSIRLVIIGATITGITALLCVFEHAGNGNSQTGAKLGFTAVETALVAVERIAKFAHLPPEPELELPMDPDSNWPGAGHIVFDHAWMKYRPELDPVLKDLCFEVNPGERVGVCGRTGAGKSSILTALFRIAPIYKGSIRIDGVDISGIGLHSLRRRISIIPQEPVLFSGTLRWNLDPLNQFTDLQLWSSLEEANMKENIEGRDGQLEMSLEVNGDNLSVGQRQLVCLARALLRNSKVLVLDEATASIDRKTDTQVQHALRKLKGVTTFTIAHRIDTIIDSDKILVLGAGRVLQFDSPEELLKDKEGDFYGIMQEYHASGASDDTEESSNK